MKGSVSWRVVLVATLLCSCRVREETDARRTAAPPAEAAAGGLTLGGGSTVNVTTYRNDNSASGLNAAEAVLSPANVNPQSFGKLRNLAVDGQVYTQPLVAAQVPVTVGGASVARDLVFVGTEHDSIYAVDSLTSQAVWTQSLLPARAGYTVTPVPAADVQIMDITPEIGVTGTPVVDLKSNTLYVVAKTKEVKGAEVHYVQRLHALDLGDGHEKLGGPAVIADTIAAAGGAFVYDSGPAVAGTGGGSANGQVPFNALTEHQRAALLLDRGRVYVAWASHGDNGNYHGWIIGFDAATLAPAAVFNTTPNGSEGGIWMAGGKLEVDAAGNLYAVTGNGTFDSTLNAQGLPASGDYGDAVLKLAPDASTSATPNANGWGLHVADYFVPFNQAFLALPEKDLDFGSGGVALLPDALGSPQHPHLMLAGGKAAWIYLLDRDHMGHFNSVADQVVQMVPNQVWVIFSTPLVYGNKVYYATGSGLTKTGYPGKAFTVAGGALSAAPTAQTSDLYSWPGSTMAVSANGAQGAVLWALDKTIPELRAYSPDNFATQLYASHLAPNGRDALPGYTKFSVPTVANGLVFVGAGANLTTYGLFVQPTPTPTPTPTPDRVVTVDISGLLQRADVPVLVDGAVLTVNAGSAATTTNFGWYNLIFKQTVPAGATTMTFTVCAAKLGYATHCTSPTVPVPAGDAITAPLNVSIAAFRPRPAAGSSPVANWVRALYIDVLGRDVTAAESAAAVHALAQGTTKTAFVMGLLRAPENRALQVHEYYRLMLRRTAAAGEVRGWVTEFTRGLTETQVAAAFYGLAEYYHDSGSTAEGFVESLYRGILGRASDAAGKSVWVAKLATESRQALTLQFLLSDEYRRHVLVPGFYHRWLKRAPTATELATVLNWLSHGYAQDQVQAILLASKEAYQKAQYGN